MKAPEPPPLGDELAALLRRMRLPYMRAAAPEVIATAKSQRWDPAEVLRVLLTVPRITEFVQPRSSKLHRALSLRGRAFAGS
jgi:hypothetical protein